MIQKEKIIIDTDPGIDDAVAIIFAMFSKYIDIKLITTVAGNVDVNKTTENALKILSEYNKSIPVAKGMNQPILQTLETASHVHGDSGMDGYKFKKPNFNLLLNKHAIQAMCDQLAKLPNKSISIVALAPLTNIAIFLLMYPELKTKIKRIVLMGGAINRGNASPAAEFNFYSDPEAAKIVLSQSNLDITIVPLEIGLKSLIYKNDINQFKKLNKTGQIFYSLFNHYRGGSLNSGLKMYDPTVITYIEHPEFFETIKCYADVQTAKRLTYGYSLFDLRNKLKLPANINLCTDIDSDQFNKWFHDSMTKCN